MPGGGATGSAEHAFNYYTVAQVGVVAIECP